MELHEKFLNELNNGQMFKSNETFAKDLEDIAKKHFEQLKLCEVSRSTKECSHKSDNNKMSYLKWIEFAESETAKGNFQKQCNNCKKWYFPLEF